MKALRRLEDKLKSRLGEKKYTSLSQLVKFCIVGALNTLVDWAVYSLFYYAMFGQAERLSDAAFAAGWCAGVACSYICNKYWTFGQKKRSGRQLVLFIILNLAVFGLGLVCYKLLAGYNIDGLPAKIITTPVTLIVNFLGNKLIVFRRSDKETGGRE